MHREVENGVGIKDKDGNGLADEKKVMDRWIMYFQKQLNAGTSQETIIKHKEMKVSPEYDYPQLYHSSSTEVLPLSADHCLWGYIPLSGA